MMRRLGRLSRILQQLPEDREQSPATVLTSSASAGGAGKRNTAQLVGVGAVIAHCETLVLAVVTPQ